MRNVRPFVFVFFGGLADGGGLGLGGQRMCVRMRGAASRLVGGITLGSMSVCISDLGCFVSFRSFFFFISFFPVSSPFCFPSFLCASITPPHLGFPLPPISPPLSLSVFAPPVWTPGRSPESAQDPFKTASVPRTQDVFASWWFQDQVLVFQASRFQWCARGIWIKTGRDVMKPRSGLEDVTKAEPKICVRRVVKRSRYGVMNTGSKAFVLAFGGSVIKIPVGSYCEEGEECGEER
jgi:hypothetical protein